MVTSASAPNSQAGPSNPFSRAQIVSDPDADALLESTTGELALFRALTRVRPIGLHGFHILAIRAHVARDTGIFVPPESLWRKLGTCYDISNIQSYEPDGYPVGDNHPPYVAADRPHWPTDTIDVHTFPYFVADFTLPSDPIIDADIAIRRVASRESSPSHSLASSEPPTARALRGAKRKRAAATLVSGESDSSALTESGEEGTAPTTTATIEDTEDDEEDDEDASTRGVSPTATRRRGRGARGGSAQGTSTRGGRGRGRGRGASKRRKRGGD